MDIKKRSMIEALEKSLGIVTTAAKSCDIARSTHYGWMDTDPEYKKAVEGISDMAIDFAESQLSQLIQGAKHDVVTNKGEIVQIRDAPNPTSVIFYLKTKGKKRGYVETNETIYSEKSIFKCLDINTDVHQDNGTSENS